MHRHPLLRHARTFAATTVALTLAACGGGGDDAGGGPTPAPTASAQGVWLGTTANNRAVTGLVLSDGSYFILYAPAGDPTGVAGVVQGTGAVSGNTFSSTNARDFYFEGTSAVIPGNVTATVGTKQTFNGTIAYTGGGGTTFTSAYDARFETVPTLAAVAGVYSGNSYSSAGSGGTTITIATNGAISSNAGGCAISGTVTPRVDGNAYAISFVFGPAPCFFANQTLTGTAYFNSTTKRLISVTPNAARTDALLYVGTKP